MPKFICPYDWQKDLTTFMKNRTPKSGQVLQAVAMDNWATKLTRARQGGYLIQVKKSYQGWHEGVEEPGYDEDQGCDVC